MVGAAAREILYQEDAAAWERWLIEHHDSSPGVRLAIAKKGSAHSSVSYSDAVDVALCFGWIDGQKSRLDDDHYLQLFTPRGARSIWSQVNRDRVLRLVESGRMRPAGQAEVDRARADGRWDAAYAPQSTAEVPADLAAALAAEPSALRFFEQLSSVNRYAILFRIANVKRAETRARKIADYVAMLARGETIHPQ
ncbi:YdeI/OmpD-associated family protein [Glaciibacter sp. 2TAF33]|uniref:YdeI/OmpD-associated family protein n=1 Tax=Glaciibacter sp. 2TAF33 TaxID=3233015 RepID=UPI003F91FE34